MACPLLRAITIRLLVRETAPHPLALCPESVSRRFAFFFHAFEDGTAVSHHGQWDVPIGGIGAAPSNTLSGLLPEAMARFTVRISPEAPVASGGSVSAPRLRSRLASRRAIRGLSPDRCAGIRCVLGGDGAAKEWPTKTIPWDPRRRAKSRSAGAWRFRQALARIGPGATASPGRSYEQTLVTLLSRSWMKVNVVNGSVSPASRTTVGAAPWQPQSI